MQSVEAVIKTVRNKERPNARFYIEHIFRDFFPLSGDRLFGDDPAVLCGVATLQGVPVTVIGQCRGRSLSENLECRFSMSQPEGYRKALRMMAQAEKFGRPVICLVDTLGAYPGREAEERGQGAAIAECLKAMVNLRTPVISVLIGEGGSGGALAFCVADEVAALENAVLSVISPKGCAQILWKDTSREMEAAAMLKMTSNELLKMGVVDRVLEEPGEGAHTAPQWMAERLEGYLLRAIHKYRRLPVQYLVKRRNSKYRRMGE